MKPPVWIRGFLSFNGAVAIRAARCGVSDALDRARQAFARIDPFGLPDADLSGIPETGLNQIVPEPPDVLLDARYATVDGSLGPFELITLLAIAKDFNPRGVLEIGTFFGSTTRNFAMNLPHAKIHTIDLPPDFSSAQTAGNGNSARQDKAMPKDDFHLIDGRRVGAAFLQKPEAARIVQHFGDTAVYDFSSINDPLDFFFIDGSHTYEYARSDTLRCFRLASRQCVMLWHDVNKSHAGVVQWISELKGAGLDVQRIRGTAIAYLKFSPEDSAIARLKAG